MNKTRQRGGALMISIVLIFMMSLMGVSAMRSATLEKRMATNSVHKATTLQAAESATELAVGEPDNLSGAFVEQGDAYVPSVNLNANTELSIDAEVRFIGMGPAINNSIGSGGFAALRFEATGNAEIDSVKARSRIVQGAYRIAPTAE